MRRQFSFHFYFEIYFFNKYLYEYLMYSNPTILRQDETKHITEVRADDENNILIAFNISGCVCELYVLTFREEILKISIIISNIFKFRFCNIKCWSFSFTIGENSQY